jgi:hypothetical protein
MLQMPFQVDLFKFLFELGHITRSQVIHFQKKLMFVVFHVLVIFNLHDTIYVPNFDIFHNVISIYIH